MIIPIMLITQDSLDDFVNTLNSLQKSDLNNNPIIIIDNSENNIIEKFLYTNDLIEFNNQKFLGINGKYTIIKSSKHLSKDYIILFAINSAFKLFSQSSTCVIINDNCKFNKYWLYQLNKLYNQNSQLNLSILSNYNKFYDETNSDEIKINESIDGKIIMVTYNFYVELKKINYFSIVYLNENNTIYNALRSISNQLGFNSLKTNKSMII